MTELSDGVFAQIRAHWLQGDALFLKGNLANALEEFTAAWNLLPEPKTNWEVAYDVLCSIGVVHFCCGDWHACLDALQIAVKGWDDALENPFIRLRIGQSLYELGNLQEAANWMVPAYLMEGAELFEGDDPKYLTFIKSKLQPPPGGWPDGW